MSRLLPLIEGEVEKLFKLMRDLKAKGVGIIFVTHFLDQVYEVCDKITVLRDGQLVGEYEIENLPRVQLVSKMLGKELDDSLISRVNRAHIKTVIIMHRYLKQPDFAVTQESNRLISILKKVKLTDLQVC